MGGERKRKRGMDIRRGGGGEEGRGERDEHSKGRWRGRRKRREWHVRRN